MSHNKNNITLLPEERQDNPYNISYDHYLDTNACTECTGIAYKPAENREEWDIYHDIFDFSPSSSTTDEEAT